jgi:hypothetical protein
MCRARVFVLLAVTASLASTRIAAADLFQPYVTKSVTDGTDAVAIGDVTGDGRPDLVAVQSLNDTVYVFAQTPAGTLAPAVRYSVPITYVFEGSVAIADMDGDGRNDVVVNMQDAVGVMLQTPGGTLSAPATYATSHSSFSNVRLLRTGDLNHDGRADVASIDWGTQSDDVDVFVQGMNHKLTHAAGAVIAHDGYDDFEVADVNHDGRDDLVVMSGQGFGANLGIATQSAGGGFDPPAYYFIGGNVTSQGMGVGDVNGDGRKDVVLTYGGNGGQIALFLQDPGGTLAPQISLPSYDVPEACEVADIDHDGKDDVIVAHGGWLRLGVYLQGASGLGAEQLSVIPYTSHYQGHALAIGDLNHDGWLDVALADGLGVTILYNTAPYPTAVQASVMNAEPSPGRVDLAWQLGEDVSSVVVERASSADSWSPIATVAPDGSRRVAYVDKGVADGGRYGYRLAITETAGVSYAGEVWVEVPAGRLALAGAVANPSPRNLSVAFALSSAEAATLAAFDLAGRRVAAREVGSLGPGGARHETGDRSGGSVGRSGSPVPGPAPRGAAREAVVPRTGLDGTSRS